MGIKSVYLDHNATTPLDPSVRDVILQALQEPEFQAWGNPSSIHWAGRRPKTILRETRQNLAKYFGVHPLELIFTSGGSESNNTVLRGVIHQQLLLGKNEVITTQLEHPSVLRTLQDLKMHYPDLQVHFLTIDLSGRFPFSELLSKLNSKTALVSIMAANNETGLLLPIPQITQMVHAAGALMHSDCVQIFGKMDLPLAAWGVDYASISAHKFYGLKGTGVLYVKKNKPFENLITGGGQERYRRGGTENVLGILALGEMSKKLYCLSEKAEQMKILRDQMEDFILQNISDVQVNHRSLTNECERLPNTSNLLISGIDGETLLMSLDLKGFAVSTGAACSSGNPEPSPVLLALGLTKAQAQTSLRISLGWSNTEEQIQEFCQVLKSTVERLRNLSKAESQSVHSYSVNSPSVKAQTVMSPSTMESQSISNKECSHV